MQAVKIALIGPMGAGKTSIGSALSKLLHCNFIDTDQAIEQQYMLSIKQIFNLHGEQHFRQQELAIIRQSLMTDNLVLATGGGSILSAQINSLLQQCVVCYLQVSVEQQLLRLKDDQHRPLLPTEPLRASFLHNLAKQRNCLYTQVADIIVNTDHMAIEQLTTKLLQEIAGYIKQGQVCT